MKNPDKIKNVKRDQRRKRNRAKIYGTAEKPRLSVFRSNRYTYAQLIDDAKGITLASASTHSVKEKKGKTTQANALGALIAEQALKAGIKQAVFNKGPYLFHGRVKAVAEGAREAGLKL